MTGSGDAEATATAAGRGASVPKAAPAAHLFLVLHCDSPMLGGARYCLDAIDEVVFARAAERSSAVDVTSGGAVLSVRIPGTCVSRTHARLIRAHETWVLADLESRNGTFVNGKRVQRAILADGDVFECGRTLFLFRSSIASAVETRPDRDEIPSDALLATLLPSLEASHDRLKAVARADLPVLLLGESGSGKEIAARAIHNLSGRAGALVAMNCAAVPHGLLESQLFGHVKGAFSGAVRDETGYFRAAHQGTLFLDEIGDLPLASQAAFLRALEEGAVVPVGTTKPIEVAVRIVAATNRPLGELVSQGAFRADLLARISGFTHRLLPLRERIGDLGLLIAALLPRLAGANAERVAFTAEAGFRLAGHEWPLNVRELRNCLASALVIANGALIDVSDIEPALANALDAARPASLRPSVVGEGEASPRDRLVAALQARSGNVAAVARDFGTSQSAGRRLMTSASGRAWSSLHGRSSRDVRRGSAARPRHAAPP